MHYKLIISERAEMHIDNILDYSVNVLKNPGAARGYRKIMLSSHAYLILYRVVDDEVQIAGVFHMLQTYAHKL